jgi:type II secretory pathway component PulJ
MDAAREQRIVAAALDLYAALRTAMQIVRKSTNEMTLIERVTPKRFADALVGLVKAIEGE